mgnify:FL=1|jgi:hypothetical protein|nr:MAG TPA: capsid protein [Caudoviricetes sp.]
MQQFDFNNSRYAKLFSSKDNINFLRTFLNTKGLLYTNYGWYLTQGRRASMPTPTDYDGVASFSIKSRKAEAAPLMHLRAPLGDAPEMDNEGLEMYTGTIPDFIGYKWSENARQREYKEKLFEQFGNDADLMAAWVRDVVQVGKNSAEATLSNLTAQIMTTAKMSWKGKGEGLQQFLQKVEPFPTENRKKAGAKAWTDPDCNLISQMRKIEDDYRDERGGTEISLVWKMTRKMYRDVFLQNKEVKEWYINWCKAHDRAYTANMQILDEDFKKSLSDMTGLSPIEIVVEKERNKTVTTDTFVQGWDDKIVVLCPTGDSVEFKWTPIYDQTLQQKYGAKNIDVSWASIADGLVTVGNYAMDNGQFREWQTKVMMSACPALLDFMNHVIIDTSTAGN